MAVSKTQPAAAVRVAIAAGQREFGENYVQEALDKMAALGDALAQAVAALPRLRLRGLMAIPEAASGFDAQRAVHRRLAQLLDTLRASGLALDTLSMGMSADMAAAVAEGATLVRVGTAIFGARAAKATASAAAADPRVAV